MAGENNFVSYVPANMNAEVYRNLFMNKSCTEKSTKVYDFIHIHNDGTTILGMNDLTGRIQNAAINLYKTPDNCLADSKTITTLNSEKGITAALFLEKDLIIVSEDIGVVRVYTTKTYSGKKNSFSTIGYSYEHHGLINALISLSGNHKCVTGGSDHDLQIKVWDIRALSGSDMLACVHSYYPAHCDFVTGLAADPANENIFMSCSNDRTALLWDTRNEKPATGVYTNEHSLRAVAWQPQSTLVALGDIDGIITTVDIRQPYKSVDTVRVFETPVSNMEYNSLCPSQLAVCGETSEVKVLKIHGDFQLIYEDDRHTDFVQGLAWYCNDLYTCGWDKQVKVHDVK